MGWPATIGWALLAAACFTLIWPPFECWWLAFVAVAPLSIMAIAQPTARRALLVTTLTQALPWGFVHAWMVQLTPPGGVMLDFYCALYMALFAVLVRRVARSPRTAALPMALVIPLLWSGTEYLRSTVVLGGYPWYTLGLPLAGTPESPGWFAQSASLGGVHLLSTVAAMVGGSLVDLWRLREGAGDRRRVWRWVAITLLLQAANLGFGVWVIETTTTAPGPTVLVVQTDLSVSNKNAWSKEHQERDTVVYLKATIAGATDAKEKGVPLDLIAWPETMVPGFGLDVETIRTLVQGEYYPGSMYADVFAGMQERLGIPLLVGSGSYVGLRANTENDGWAWDKHYNSAYLIDGPPPYARYDKLFLTPMGEEMPLISRWEWLEKELLALSAPGMTFDLEAGEKPVRFTVPWRSAAPAANDPGGQLRFVTPICFEDTSGPLCRTLCYEAGVRQVDLMVNLSNDGWFGWSATGRSHHVLHARMRSIELAVPMIRCANTGQSVAIEWNGQVSGRIGEAGAAPAVGTGTMVEPLRVRRCDRTTLYGRIGDLWPWLMVAATGYLWMRSRRIGERSASPVASSHRERTLG